jgi:hypothetical protein
MEAMLEHPEHTPTGRALRAALLTLRLFDEWMALGAIVAEGASPIVRTTRAAVDAVPEDGDLQFHLTRIVDGILMLREPDASAVLPRVVALAELYAQRGESALAGDVRALVVAHGHGAPQRISAPTEALA